MRHKVAALALAAAAAALALVPLPTAQAAYDTCDGQKTTVTGSGKNEIFRLTPERRVINAHGGNDVISSYDLKHDLAATVCMGSGDDVLRVGDDGSEAVPVRFLDGGSGFDKAEIYICFEGDAGPKWTLRNVERITVVNCLD